MRCKSCKEIFDPVYFNQKFCMSYDSCITAHIEYAKKETAKQWKKRKRKLKEELKTISDYHKEAQFWFNKVIRERDKNQPCISCGVTLKGKKFDAGHYYSQGGHSSVRYNFYNVFGQCTRCNRELSGNLIEYRKGLLKRIGEQKLEMLEILAHQERSYTIDELKQKIKNYKRDYKDMTLEP